MRKALEGSSDSLLWISVIRLKLRKRVEALKLLENFHPDIIVTDIKMPRMDGIDLLKAIKEDHPHIEVIMLTGHGDLDLAIESLKNDAADFITKPVDDVCLNSRLSG